MRPAARFFVDPFLLVDRLPVGHCACAAGGSAVTVSARARASTVRRQIITVNGQDARAAGTVTRWRLLLAGRTAGTGARGWAGGSLRRSGAIIDANSRIAGRLHHVRFAPTQ